MRLDRFLVECGIGSRKEVKKIISAKEVKVNDSYDISAKDNINEYSDIIEYNGERLEYKEFRYYIMNKKAGYITATEDIREATVMDLLPEWVIKKDLAPVGRLDKDTEGLLLLTEEGVDIGNYITLPAKVEKISDTKIYLTIKEGKFHQVKKMLEAVGNKVTYLQRTAFAKLKLNDLALGEVKEINLEDII